MDCFFVGLLIDYFVYLNIVVVCLLIDDCWFIDWLIDDWCIDWLWQTFLSELYVYLVDQMHQSLNKVLQIEDQPPIPPPLTTNAQLKHFAHEAEVNKDFDLATKYYQEVSGWRQWTPSITRRSVAEGSEYTWEFFPSQI